MLLEALSRNVRCARSGAASLGRPPISEGDACPTFIDESSGEIMEVCIAAQTLCTSLRSYCRWLTPRDPQVMCCDYGFRSGNMRLYQDNYGSVPRSVFVLVTFVAAFVCGSMPLLCPG